MDIDRSAAFLEFLHQPQVHEMLSRSGREALLWDEFRAMECPSGASVEEMWELVKALRCAYSVEIPVPSPQGTRLHYFMHQDMLARLRLIDYHCHPDSRFSLDLFDRQGSPFIVRTQIQEAVATGQLDGLDVLPDDAEEVIRLDRKPRNGEESIVKNTFRVMSDIDVYARERFSPELLDEFYARITSGVDPGSVKRRKDSLGLTRESYRRMARARSDKPLSLICAYCNDEIGDPREHPAMRALTIRGLINHWLPMPDWNGNVASLVFRLYCLKHEYSAVGYLPFSHANLAWARREIRAPAVLCESLPDPYVDRHGCEDHTPIATLALHLLDYELQALLAHMQSVRENDAAVMASFDDDRSLNHRQRLIVARALREPTAEFRIRHHQINHRVAYATARTDLLDLVDGGYLVCEKRNRAFVFSANLQKRLG